MPVYEKYLEWEFFTLNSGLDGWLEFNYRDSFTYYFDRVVKLEDIVIRLEDLLERVSKVYLPKNENLLYKYYSTTGKIVFEIGLALDIGDYAYKEVPY